MKEEKQKKKSTRYKKFSVSIIITSNLKIDESNIIKKDLTTCVRKEGFRISKIHVEEIIYEEKLKKKSKRKNCSHKNTYVIKEGMTGLYGRVICSDCGYEREWNAY